MGKELPKWAKLNKDDGFIEVEPGVVYPYFLKRLGFEGKTQDELEVARRCFTTELKDTIGGGFSLRILKDDDYKLAKFPKGDDLKINPERFRAHYNRMADA
jgi:hypothetical protein